MGIPIPRECLCTETWHRTPIVNLPCDFIIQYDKYKSDDTNGIKGTVSKKGPPFKVYNLQGKSWIQSLLVTLLALCEGNPPVTGGFPSQRDSNVKFWCVFVVSLNNCWTISRVAGDITCHDVHVTSLLCACTVETSVGQQANSSNPSSHIHCRLRCCPCPILWGWQKKTQDLFPWQVIHYK